MGSVFGESMRRVSAGQAIVMLSGGEGIDLSVGQVVTLEGHHWLPGRGGDKGRVLPGLGVPYLLPSLAAVVVGGTPLTGGKGGYVGTMAGALLPTVLNSLLTTLPMPEYARQIVYGVTLLLLLSVYGREEALRQQNRSITGRNEHESLSAGRHVTNWTQR